ncbi:MAG: glycosyltransferase [Ilumatobacteraceae bacterium]
MEPASTLAPPVVAVMIVHEPGPWFDEALAGLSRQDYANLKVLVLVAGDPGDLARTITEAVPRAFVRAVDDLGFGPVANEVLRLVEGENGFFCFLHDDVALDPDAIRLLVEEVYRSNAGIVGPKLVDWNDSTVLQHVGYGVDRFGDVDPMVEPGETDQEQHDAVRDVFALPSACLLVRADLFTSLGGFDADIAYHGEDVDLCWRAHLQGARVLVVPSARARHRESLVERRPDLDHVAMRERHRMFTVAALTGARRLPLLLLELVVVTLAQFVASLFSGHAARGWAGLRGLVGLVPDIAHIVRRRREIAATRLVPDREVVGLQIRGSARVAAYLRSRDARPDPTQQNKAWRERSGGAAAIGFLVLVAAVLIGGRHVIAAGVPRFGQFLPFPDGPSGLLRSYANGWNPRGLGASAPLPTGFAVVAAGSVVTLFRMGLFHTITIVGLVIVAAAGMWRLTSAYSLTRARLVTTALYALVPLPAASLSMGRWGALLVFAAMPWSIDLMRRFAGLQPGPADETGERVIGFGSRRHVRLLAGGVLVAAIVVAFEPSYLLMLLSVSVLLAVATLFTGAPMRSALRFAVAGVVAVAGGALLGLPWLVSLVSDGGWSSFVGPTPVGDRGNTVLQLLTFDLGRTSAAVIALALYLPVVVSLLVGRGWRLGWAARGGTLVIAFAWFAVLDDRGAMPFRLPEPGIVLVPVAVGLALAAGCVVGSFELDVRGGSFGWRQPLSLLACVAVGVGMVPGVLALGNGRWNMPTTTMADLLGWFPDDASGDYRVLWVGDDGVVPARPTEYRPGVGYAITSGGDLDLADAWPAPATGSDDDIAGALDAISFGTTTRAGRLLAPYAVRYVVVPLVDGAVSTSRDPVAPPAGLVDALGDQLDLAQVYSPPNFLVYENRAWVAERSVLTASGADASGAAGVEALAQADISGAAPIMIGADHRDAATAPVEAGATVHVAVPFDRAWALSVDGIDVPPRPAFGSTMAFDTPAAGTAELAYETERTHALWVFAQLLGWCVVALATTNIGARRGRRAVRTRNEPVEPVITLDPLVQSAVES